MQNLMFLDPRRRFVFGYTIENCSTRLWFLSRAMLLTSAPLILLKYVFFHLNLSCLFTFDLKDHKHLVRFFFAVAFSSPTDMGWDPSIRLLHMNPGTGHRTYQISIEMREGEETRVYTYTTVSILSDYAANSFWVGALACGLY